MLYVLGIPTYYTVSCTRASQPPAMQHCNIGCVQPAASSNHTASRAQPPQQHSNPWQPGASYMAS
jgi:hypothetical protein